ncbi:hypothetical protein SCLCIDRAFT_1223151, partial [Scleroderma citrinum Foug A]
MLSCEYLMSTGFNTPNARPGHRRCIWVTWELHDAFRTTTPNGLWTFQCRESQIANYVRSSKRLSCLNADRARVSEMSRDRAYAKRVRALGGQSGNF